MTKAEREQAAWIRAGIGLGVLELRPMGGKHVLRITSMGFHEVAQNVAEVASTPLAEAPKQEDEVAQNVAEVASTPLAEAPKQEEVRRQPLPSDRPRKSDQDDKKK